MIQILALNTRVVYGTAQLKEIFYNLENDCILESIACNVHEAGMVYFTRIKFGEVEYVNGKDDAILYYPLVESGGIVAKRECRRLGRMFCHGGSEIHVECLYNGFIPPGRWAGSEFELCISLETFELA